MFLADTNRYTVIGSARIDHDRLARRGLPEAVLCQGKKPAQVADIFRVFQQQGQTALGTRAEPAHFDAVAAVLPEAVYDAESRLLLWHPRLSADEAQRLLDPPPAADAPLNGTPYVAAVSAGTSDWPVLKEAVGSLNVFGIPVQVIYDAGVACIDRIIDQRPVLDASVAIIVAAGMDGALPSVIAGLVSSPIIAVPTSVGYGAHFSGLAPLLAMLNNCSAGVTVVNIDNGFGAAWSAALLVRKVIHHGVQ